MLKLMKYSNKLIAGAKCYQARIMVGQTLTSDGSVVNAYFCSYDIPDSPQLRKYLTYFSQLTNSTYQMNLSSYKHLPIKPEDKDA